MVSTDRPTQITEGSSDDGFAWDSSRYESVVEQHTGIVTSLLDRGICMGLMAFGMLSLMLTAVMALMQLGRLFAS